LAKQLKSYRMTPAPPKPGGKAPTSNGKAPGSN
jgi:hypothetical protein